MSLFEKKYSRESTLMVQEVWMNSSLIDLPRMFKGDPAPKPAILIDCADGIIEIWISEVYSQWVVAKAAQYFGQDSHNLQIVIRTYQEKLSALKKLYTREPTTINDLKQILKEMQAALSYLMILFYVITSEESEQECRDLALKVREEDTFFVDAEIYLEKALKEIFPKAGNLFSVITIKDLDSEMDLGNLKMRREKCLFLDGELIGNFSINEYIVEHPEIKLHDTVHEVEEAKEFKGQIAQKGLVTGRVRIVKKREQAAMVEEGEIIVSPMTTPDFLPAMIKAAAFITDEGGITCHASIVSRELKKPCVIGTKIATKVLKDGDFVEVNANEGIIRILK